MEVQVGDFPNTNGRTGFQFQNPEFYFFIVSFLLQASGTFELRSLFSMLSYLKSHLSSFFSFFFPSFCTENFPSHDFPFKLEVLLYRKEKVLKAFGVSWYKPTMG